jgi:hypothetical protein
MEDIDNQCAVDKTMHWAQSESWDGWKQEAKRNGQSELNVQFVGCHYASKVSRYGHRWTSSLIQLGFDIAWDLWIYLKGILQLGLCGEVSKTQKACHRENSYRAKTTNAHKYPGQFRSFGGPRAV